MFSALRQQATKFSPMVSVLFQDFHNQTDDRRRFHQERHLPLVAMTNYRPNARVLPQHQVMQPWQWMTPEQLLGWQMPMIQQVEARVDHHEPRALALTDEEVDAIVQQDVETQPLRFNQRPVFMRGMLAAATLPWPLAHYFMPFSGLSPSLFFNMYALTQPRFPLYPSLTTHHDEALVEEDVRIDELETDVDHSTTPNLGQVVSINQEAIDRILDNPRLLQTLLLRRQLTMTPMLGDGPNAPLAFTINLLGLQTTATLIHTPTKPPALQLAGGLTIPMERFSRSLLGLPQSGDKTPTKTLALETGHPTTMTDVVTPKFPRGQGLGPRPFKLSGDLGIGQKPFKASGGQPFIPEITGGVDKRSVRPAPQFTTPESLLSLSLGGDRKKQPHSRHVVKKPMVDEGKRGLQQNLAHLRTNGDENDRRLADDVEQETKTLLEAKSPKEREDALRDYQTHANTLQQSGSVLWRNVGIAMMVLGVALMAAGAITMVSTLGLGTGVLAGGAAVLASGVGLFAANRNASSTPAREEDHLEEDGRLGLYA